MSRRLMFGDFSKAELCFCLKWKTTEVRRFVFLQYTAWGALACLVTGPFLRRCRALHILSAELYEKGWKWQQGKCYHFSTKGQQGM